MSIKSTIAVCDEEWIRDPSPLSRSLIAIQSQFAVSYHNQLSTKNPFKKLVFLTRVHAYFRHDYRSLISFFEDYMFETDAQGTFLQRLEVCYLELSKLFEQLLFNNMVLTYFWPKRTFETLPFLTKEEELYKTLALLSKGDIQRLAFDKSFGHCSLNPYEFSSPRFSELSTDELMRFGEAANRLSCLDKQPFSQVIDNDDIDKVAVLVGIRELGKYEALKVISEMRAIFLGVEKRMGMACVFDLSWSEVREKLRDIDVD